MGNFPVLISQAKLLWSARAAGETSLGGILALPSGGAGGPSAAHLPSGDSSWLRKVLAGSTGSQRLQAGRTHPYLLHPVCFHH